MKTATSILTKPAKKAVAPKTPHSKNSGKNCMSDETFVKTLTPDTRRLVRALWKLHGTA